MIVLSIFEDGIPPVFRIKFESWVGSVISFNEVVVETTRPDNNRQVFQFSSVDGFYQSNTEIPEPHQFTAVVKTSVNGSIKEYPVEFIEHDHGHDHGHHDNHDHNEHDHKEHDHNEHDHKEHDHKEHEHKKKKKTHNLSLVSSVGFTIEGLLDVPLFNTFMSTLLQAKAADLYRTKGVLAFANQGDAKFVFQGVHEQINFGPSDKPWGPDEKRLSKMVFIGK